MTPLRQEAFQLLDSMPEEALLSVIQYLQTEKFKRLSKRQRIMEKRIALDELLLLSKSVSVDEKKELAQYREEKFGHANLD